ncbi:hypothetical protein KR054_011168 [Drosophila jambulina]|nr:hypothetical protein KR054_011168 [Drosophila jambulina]
MYNPAALCILLSILIITAVLGDPLSYYISPITTNFFVARDHCIDHNGDLATFDSIAELEAVSNYLIQNGIDDLLWVSYWDLGRPQGLFHSIATGKLMTISSWVDGQPDNFEGIEHCVHIVKRNGKYGMNDCACNSILRALCQRRK